MKYFVLALVLSISSLTLANTPAQVQRVDFTGFPFTNFCNGEPANRAQGSDVTTPDPLGVGHWGLDEEDLDAINFCGEE